MASVTYWRHTFYFEDIDSNQLFDWLGEQPWRHLTDYLTMDDSTIVMTDDTEVAHILRAIDPDSLPVPTYEE